MNQGLAKLLGIKEVRQEEVLGLYISSTTMFLSHMSDKESEIGVQSLVKIPVVLSEATQMKALDLNEGFFSLSENWVPALKNVLERKKFKAKKVIVSLAPEFSLLRHFVIPSVEKKYWKQSIPLQARKYIHFPLEKAKYAFHVYPVETAISKQERLGVVFAMTTANIMKAIQDGLKSLGCEMLSVEIGPFSSARVYNMADKEAVGDKGRIYSFFGTTGAQMLFLNGDMPVLFRDVDISGPLPIERRKLDVGNFIDFVSKQIEKDIFEEAIVMGQNTDQWGRVLEADSRKPVRTWDIKESIGFEAKDVGEICSVGACLKVKDKEMPDMDMLGTGGIMSTEERSALVTSWIIVALAIIGMAAWNALTYFGLQSSMLTLSSEKKKTVQIDDFIGVPAQETIQRVETMLARHTSLQELTRPAPITVDLVGFVDNLPEQMWITRLIYKKGLKKNDKSNNMTMEGYIFVEGGDIRDDINMGNSFRDKLINAKVFSEVCTRGLSIAYPPEKAGAFATSKFTLKCTGEAGK